MVVAAQIRWFDVSAAAGAATASLRGSFAGGAMTLAGIVTIALGAAIAVRRAPVRAWIVLVAAILIVGGAGFRGLLAPSEGAADALSVRDAERLGVLIQPIEVRESLDREVRAGRLHADPGPGPWLAVAGAALVAGPVALRAKRSGPARVFTHV